MDGRYNTYSQGRTGWTAFRDREEFQEGDVWAVFSERGDSSLKIRSYDSPSITPRRLPAADRMIPRGNNHSKQEPKLVQHSAPVNIPDWSKIYGTSSKKASMTDVEGRGDAGIMVSSYSDDDADEDELDRAMMPPHEWLAKKLARTRVSSFSVCEGAGRTLKGRDLSRVRNAVLTRTGFLE